MDVVEVTNRVLRNISQYLYDNDFIQIVTPHITNITGACENLDTLFKIDYFGNKAFLAQTGQLYLETKVKEYGKVWCVGSSFRAEPIADHRHLTEFCLLEIEHEGDLKELLGYIEGMIVAATKGSNVALVENFDRLTYSEAIWLLEDLGFQLEWGSDLSSIHERALVDDRPLFITHYPTDIKFFNMRQNDENPQVVNSADLILPHALETVGAAEREYKYDRIVSRLQNSKMFKQLEKYGKSIDDFKWYLDYYKRHKGILHSGCGVGINRLVQYIMDSDSIVDSTVYPTNSEMLY